MGKIKEIQLIFFPVGALTYFKVSTVYICLTGGPSGGCLIGVNPDNDNDDSNGNNAMNCQQLLPYFISALPGIIRHLKIPIFVGTLYCA